MFLNSKKKVLIQPKVNHFYSNFAKSKKKEFLKAKKTEF